MWRALDDIVKPERASTEGRFDLPSVAYYLGAVLVIVAMFVFMGLAWREYGGGSLLALALVYGLFFLAAGTRLWRRGEARIAAGLVLTLAVFMVPLAVYGGQILLGLWPQSLGATDPPATENRLIIEASALAAGLAMIAAVRFSFLAVPILLAAWLISFDLVNLATWPEINRGDTHEIVGLLFGLAAIMGGIAIDRRTREDYGFWFHLCGLASFWSALGGLTLFDGDSGPLRDAIFAAVGVIAILASVILQRAVFVVFGSLGVIGWLLDVAYGIFEDSLMFPVVLSLIGIAVIWGGLIYHRRRRAIEAWAARRLPTAWRVLSRPLPGD